MEFGIKNIGTNNPTVPAVPVKQSSSTAPSEPAEPVKLKEVPQVDLQKSDEQRMAAIRQAVAGLFKESFAVSDQSFTIFKDASGQFITRFTSLRDGSVTYVPEPQVVKHLESLGMDTSLIKLNA